MDLFRDFAPLTCEPGESLHGGEGSQELQGPRDWFLTCDSALRRTGLVQPVGAGFNAADLFDRDGRLGRTSASIVVEPRQPR